MKQFFFIFFFLLYFLQNSFEILCCTHFSKQFLSTVSTSYGKGEMLHIRSQNFPSKFGFQITCHNLMRSIILENMSQLWHIIWEKKNWKKNLRSLTFLMGKMQSSHMLGFNLCLFLRRYSSDSSWESQIDGEKKKKKPLGKKGRKLAKKKKKEILMSLKNHKVNLLLRTITNLL